MPGDTVGKGLAGTALGFAIAGLVIGWIPLLGWLVWIAGLVLAIVAIVKCKTPEDGKGMAIAAVVIMAISILFVPVLMAVGSLAYFGVLSPNKFVPDSFTMTGGLSANEYKAGENKLIFGLVNHMGTEITIERVEVQSAGRGDVTCSVSQTVNQAVANGQSYLFETDQCPGRVGQNFRADVSVTYTKKGEAVSHTATGNLMTKIE